MSTPEEVRGAFLKGVEDRGLLPQREHALKQASDLATIRRVAAQIDARNRKALEGGTSYEPVVSPSPGSEARK